jgi:hypothetical protein
LPEPDGRIHDDDEEDHPALGKVLGSKCVSLTNQAKRFVRDHIKQTEIWRVLEQGIKVGLLMLQNLTVAIRRMTTMARDRWCVYPYPV